MSSFQNPATHAWRVALALIGVDIRQGLRKHAVGASVRDRVLKGIGLFFGLSFFAILHLGAYALVAYTLVSPTADRVMLMRGLSSAVWGFLLFVMISGGLVRAIVVLHEQDDSSLLLSSPVTPRAVLAARLFGNALQSCVVDGFIIVPYINIMVFANFQWHFLWGYPTWFALAIIVTCIDGLFSFGMIRWFGLRRARLLSQAIPFILIFAVTFFAGSISVSVAQMNAGAGVHMSPAMQSHFFALARTPLALVARAAAGNPLCLALVFGSAALIAWITLRQTERAFVEGTQELAENTGPANPAADFTFRSNVLFLEIVKNARMVARTPMMVVQCIAQVLTPVGIAFVLGRDDAASAVAFFVIFVAGVLSGMFTIAAGTVEECDDLLRMSPRHVFLFRLGKILSGCLAPLALTLLAAAGLLILEKPLAACGVFFAAIPLAIASSIVGETFAKPVRSGVRPKLLSDPIMMIPLLGMQIVSGAVAGLTVFAAASSFAFLGLSFIASYLIFLVAIGLAQLRKPLF